MARGLSTAELNTIRDTLAAGRRPKVVFTEAAGQVAGQVGQVTGLTDPALSDEWVVVRFGRDELPFSPTDLTLPPKGGAPGGRRPTKRIPPAEPPAPEFKITREVPGQRADEPARTGTAANGGTAGEDRARGRAGDDTASGSGGGKAAGGGAPAAAGAAGADDAPAAPAESGGGTPRQARRPARAGKAKPIPGLTVTLAYAEGEWTVAAQQGSRTVARPYVIRATEALKMVAMLDVAGVHEAVEQIVAAERADAEAQAERLRAQLAELEARLADLREAH
jgi:hypothetical protein